MHLLNASDAVEIDLRYHSSNGFLATYSLIFVEKIPYLHHRIAQIVTSLKQRDIEHFRGFGVFNHSFTQSCGFWLRLHCRRGKDL
ncbi:MULTISPECIES: hypothetical protein [unclassified Caballeronia]|uniref:hypothetical protein n=1 Tax=unclassified Caballeronia TaxID=2646786 RepID=UPI00285E8ABA|nr:MULTISPECIES: hypothetical protein [unclassified Caballeronia]MDR5771153.1 hypothetical protein [Caballeronia sp. LZ002]MDR5801519.1 hypothetical protein [Caballeronia sp. LZ001]MDR5846590.1 hypothetical protein [Caballeronia sp. LZ003]